MKNKVGFVLLFHIYLFKFFGFCPIALNPKSGHEFANKKLRLLWPVIVVTILNVVILIVFFNSTHFLFFEEYFALFNDYLKLSATIFALNVSIWQSLLMRNHEQNFWKCYIMVRASRRPLVKDSTIWGQLWEYRIHLFKFLGIITIYVSLYYVYLAYKTDSRPQVLNFWIMYTPYTSVMLIRNIQFILYMHMIRIELDELEKDLAALVDLTEWERAHGAFDRFDEFIRKRIVEKMRIYQMIFDMSQHFQMACNGSMLIHLIGGYVRILVDCYFFLWSLSANILPLKDVLLIPAILEIPMFLLTAKSCMNAAKYISYRVHSLKRSDDNVATSIQIQNFSLQLLHQRIKIDGLGIASMDGYMLTKAVGSITTYMVFFIQFMPKFRSKFE